MNYILQVEHQRLELLKHPVVKSLIKYKWNKYGQVIYFFNLAFYSLFLIFLTSFALVVLNPSHPTCKQGLYIIFKMDWKCARRPITKNTFPFLQSSLRVKNIASSKKLQRLLGNTNGGRPDNRVSVCEGVYSKP